MTTEAVGSDGQPTDSQVALTPQGLVESWDDGAERLLGYTRHEALGRHFSVFYPPEERRAGLPEQHLRRARRGEVAHHVGWRVRQDGSRFWGVIRLGVLLAESGALLGYSASTCDLGARPRHDQVASTFYDMFLHDFRVPLAAIRGFAELAVDADADERRIFLDRVNSNADRLMAMAEDLVEHARHSSTDPTVRLESLDLADLARHVVASLVADTARITMSDAHVAVVADADALRRVVANVLTNAVKYSAPGSPISLAVERAGSTGVLRITDHGRGIDPHDLDAVFGEFERGRLARSDGGLGLGLASSRHLIETIGGAMWIESELGVGTTVIISLPRAAPARHDPLLVAPRHVGDGPR